MPLSQVVACATTNAAKLFDSSDRSTLNVGAPADVAIMELREGNLELLDNHEGKGTGRQRLFPSATVLNGKRTPARA
jgi:dihydroorotase